jgi:hypothetical protein
VAFSSTHLVTLLSGLISLFTASTFGILYLSNIFLLGKQVRNTFNECSTYLHTYVYICEACKLFLQMDFFACVNEQQIIGSYGAVVAQQESDEKINENQTIPGSLPSSPPGNV